MQEALSTETSSGVLKQTSSIDGDHAEIIEALFPPDSQFQATADIGKEIMLQAIMMGDWRDLPGHILNRMTILCQQREIAITKKTNRT